MRGEENIENIERGL